MFLVIIFITSLVHNQQQLVFELHREFVSGWTSGLPRQKVVVLAWAVFLKTFSDFYEDLSPAEQTPCFIKKKYF